MYGTKKMLAHLKGFVRVASKNNNEDSFDTLCVETLYRYCIFTQ